MAAFYKKRYVYSNDFVELWVVDEYDVNSKTGVETLMEKNVFETGDPEEKVDKILKHLNTWARRAGMRD